MESIKCALAKFSPGVIFLTSVEFHQGSVWPYMHLLLHFMLTCEIKFCPRKSKYSCTEKMDVHPHTSVLYLGRDMSLHMVISPIWIPASERRVDQKFFDETDSLENTSLSNPKYFIELFRVR